MAADLKNIRLFADSHAVEVMTFSVTLGIPIDHADIRRFEDGGQEIEKVYPSITSPETIQFAIGPSGQPHLPPPVPVKELNFYSSAGKSVWAGSYGDSTVKVLCHKYQGWKNDWPQAKERLDMLLGFIAPHKPVLSVDYSVTNSFRANRSDNVLNPSTLFQSSNDFIAPRILELADPRWDFNQGWFDERTSNGETLVRVNGHGGIEGDRVIAKIVTLHAGRLGCSVEKLLEYSDSIFDDFHNRSKHLLQRLLARGLVDRMGLDVSR